jgi:O-antigen/teichoic acid export membrane protein
LTIDFKNKVKKIFYRFWNSPTFTTWGSLFVRSFDIVLLMPLLLTRLTPGDVAIWYLFKSFISMQPIIEAGFSINFSRVIAFAIGGSNEIAVNNFEDQKPLQQNPNWTNIEKIVSTMDVVYKWVTLFALLLMLVVGSLVMRRPLSMGNNINDAWIAWLIICLGMAYNISGNKYIAYLMGTNHIPDLRRSEILLTLFALILNCLVLIFTKNLLLLTISSQICIIANVAIYKYLCRKVENEKYRDFQKGKIYPEVIQVVWPSAWRSALGQFMAFGMTQISGLIYAQIGSAPDLAAYQLALRLASNIRTFSNAPFYSKIPLMAKLYAARKMDEMIKIAKTNMKYTYWTLVFGFVSLGLFAKPLLDIIGSDTKWVKPDMWVLIAIGFFLERYGALHIQLYSITNKIIWHIANGVTGILFYLISFLLFSSIGVYAFLVANIVSNLGFYTWYSASHSYREYKLKIIPFETQTILLPMIALFAFSIFTLLGFQIPS